MNDTIKDFLISLGFEINQSQFKQFTDGITNASVRAAALGAATTAAAAAIITGVAKVANEFDKLDQLAQKYNTTAGAIDDFVDSAEMVGIGGEAAEQALQSLNRVVGEAALGVGRGAVILEKLGISATDSAGKVKSTTDVMSELQSKMATMDRGQSMAIMEKLGLNPELLRMFNGELGDLAKIQEAMAATDVSVGMDFDTAIKESKDFEKSMKSLKTESKLLLHWFTTLWESLAVKLMPKVRAGLDKMSVIFEGLRHKLQDNGKKIVEAIMPILEFIMKIGTAFVQFFARGLEVANKVVGVAIGVWNKLQDVTDGLAGKILLVVAAWKLLNLNFLKSPIGMIISLAAAALLLYDDFMTWKEGGDSLVDWGSDFGGMLLTTIGLLGSLAASVMIVKGAMMAYTAVMATVPAIMAIVNGVMTAFNFILSLNPIALVVLAIAGLIAAGIALVSNWDTVKQWFSGFFDWFTSKFSMITDVAKGFSDFFSSFFDDEKTVEVKANASKNDEDMRTYPINDRISTASANVARINGGGGSLTPTPTQMAAMNTNQSISQTTNINVTGGANPQATAAAVVSAQSGVNTNMARNMKGAVR